MKRRRRRGPSAREVAIACVLALLLAWLLYLVWGIFGKEEIARKAADDARRELSALEAREETLKRNLDELGTERGREASLRDTYGVARPGEEVIIVVPAEEEEELGKLSWWRKLLGFFGL